MRTSKAACILASALILTFSFSSCANLFSDGSSNSSSYSESQKEKEKALYNGFIDLPSKSDYAALNSEPNESSVAIAPLFLNDPVEVLSEENDWCRIRCNGYTGYVRKELISREELTVTETVTTTLPNVPHGMLSVSEEETTTSTSSTTSTTTSSTTTSKQTTSETQTTTEEKKTEQQTEKEHEPISEKITSEYPFITAEVKCMPDNDDKYVLRLYISGKFTNYNYEVYRTDHHNGREELLTTGSSDLTELVLAKFKLNDQETRDRIKIIPYLNGTEGSPVILELTEPK